MRVRHAQVQQLYQQSLIGHVGSVVVTAGICLALWWEVPQGRLLIWAGLLILVTILRGALTVAYHRSGGSETDAVRWARLHVLGVAGAGVLWAVPPFWLWPSAVSPSLLVWPICIVSLSSAAVAMYSIWKPSYLTFLFLSAVPISFRLLFEGEMLFTILGLLGLFFVWVLAKSGSLMHTASLNALLMGMRNEALNVRLAEDKAQLQQVTSELQRAHDRLRRLSLTDDLTGLWNRRFFNATIPDDSAGVLRSYQVWQEEKRNTTKTRKNLLFIMVDLDHFKQVNDSYGHQVGDMALKETARLLMDVCRDMDSVIRWGGEEFMVVAKNVDRADFHYLLERIRQAVEAHPFDVGGAEPIRLTCSIGAAVFPFLESSPELVPWEQVVVLADGCLYAAKHTSRNAWIGVVADAAATPEDIGAVSTKQLCDLVRHGALTIQTNLPDDLLIRWSG